METVMLKLSDFTAQFTTYHADRQIFLCFTGVSLHSPVPPSLALPCVTVCSQISTGLYNSYMYTETAKTIGVNTECTNFGGQKCASISFFFIEAPNICRSSVWKIYVVRKFEVCFEFCEKKVVHPALIYCPQHFT